MKGGKMASFEKMIKHFYPDAIGGTDFTIETSDKGEKTIVFWNAEKLGSMPDIKLLHDRYIEFLKKQKMLSPKTDDADPAPWLNTPVEQVRVSQPEPFRLPIVNIDFKHGIVTQEI